MASSGSDNEFDEQLTHYGHSFTIQGLQEDHVPGHLLGRLNARIQGSGPGTFANLAHILEAADPNGLDVLCTSDPENMQHNKATEKLIQFVQSNFDKSASSVCFIERALKALADKVIGKLPSGPGEKKRRITWGKNDKSRPISIYILTSEVWNSLKELEKALVAQNDLFVNSSQSSRAVTFTRARWLSSSSALGTIRLG
ncbi:hypothetical protein INS49_011574 [Diaporthe citri]|uniref:uncharacterized protein n=1 Tax=Diaporthe citri TaxID=83186 RepID=UPI001C81C307|nr:uncharacterized protein INS49_011574 [Diaporthe citri]KAG6360512.1 hypothetical protein INS49_011574 [Diaporthe citri]